MGSTGDSYDTALAETLNEFCKAEVIHRRRPCKTKPAVELAALERVAFFNSHRLMAPLGDLSPAEFEAYHRQRAGEAATV